MYLGAPLGLFKWQQPFPNTLYALTVQSKTRELKDKCISIAFWLLAAVSFIKFAPLHIGRGAGAPRETQSMHKINFVDMV